MGKIRTSSLLALVIFFIQSCISPSDDQIQKISKPDNNLIGEFGMEINGSIIYQFYQKYGFTDLEEQLIVISKPDDSVFLTAELPFDSLVISKIEYIDIRKFKMDIPVNFEPERTLHADIRLQSKEFDNRQGETLFYGEGKYGFIKNDSVETIYVFDSRTGLMYVESKKKS